MPSVTVLENMSVVSKLELYLNWNTGCDLIGCRNGVDVGQDNPKSPCFSFFLP